MNDMSGLSYKQRAFIEFYLTTWNSSEAARLAGYTGRANTVGPRLLSNVGIQAAIEKRINEISMGASEVLIRLAEHARGDMGDFLDIGSMGFSVDLNNAKEKGITRLIKKVKMRTTTTLSKEGVETETNDTEVELYDAQAALEKIGRHLRLWREQLFALNMDFSSLTDEQIDRLSRGDDPIDVILHSGASREGTA